MTKTNEHEAVVKEALDHLHWVSRPENIDRIWDVPYAYTALSMITSGNLTLKDLEGYKGDPEIKAVFLDIGCNVEASNEQSN